MGFWQNLPAIVREAHVVLIVLDARMPDMSMNPEIEGLIKKYDKESFIVFNKIDLVNSKDLNELRKKNPDAFFVSGTENVGLKGLKRELLIWGKRKGIRSVKVGIVGYPNVGKSAIINALAHRARAPTAPVAGTTKGAQYVRVSENLKIIDSPGVVPLRDKEAKLGVLAAKNPEKLKNPEVVAIDVIKMIFGRNKKALEDFYKIELKDIDDPYEILLLIGKRKGMLKKGGAVDETKTSIGIVRDWQRGKVRI